MCSLTFLALAWKHETSVIADRQRMTFHSMSAGLLIIRNLCGSISGSPCEVTTHLNTLKAGSSVRAILPNTEIL